MNKGIFISFEGGEGAGKTTLISKLAEVLRKSGREVLVTREPGGTPLGDQIRDLLLHRDENLRISDLSELLLFLSDRAQHIEETIRPALEAGQIVLCDRFSDSSIAYQGVARGLGLEKVEQLCDLVCDDTQPKLSFYLDLDPREGFARKAINGDKKDLLESEALAFHDQVREGFLRLSQRHLERIVVIDALQSPDAILQETCKTLEDRFGLCRT
ncbi:MAG: dTMP kinase [Waddliaceae bacterium]|nr:dTMP kinase [Waddliaceae bacterium]